MIIFSYRVVSYFIFCMGFLHCLVYIGNDTHQIQCFISGATCTTYLQDTSHSALSAEVLISFGHDH